MVFFDKFNTDNFNVDNQELEVLPVTTSELKQEYAELGMIKAWSLGEQTARKDGTIINRTYRQLTFSPNAIDFDLVDAGYIDEDRFGGQYYWRVLHEFSETEYYSSLDKAYKNFKIWEKSLNEFQMEITYDNLPTKYRNSQNEEVESIITWNRPKNTQSFIGLGCPLGLSPAPVNETGDGPWFSNATTSSSSTSSNISCSQYKSLPLPFYLVFDAGKSLGASLTFSSIPPTKVYISKNPVLINNEFIISNNLGTTNDPYRMHDRYLILQWDNPGRDILQKVTITFRGNEKYRSFLPLLRDNSPECPEHLDTTPYITQATLNTPTRYKPPGLYHLPDNFWNDTQDTPINNYANRITINPSLI